MVECEHRWRYNDPIDTSNYTTLETISGVERIQLDKSSEWTRACYLCGRFERYNHLDILIEVGYR